MTDSSLFRSPLSRIVVGGVTSLSLVLFVGVWIATAVTSGFSLASATMEHTFAGWTYFPLFWPHLVASTLGFLIFLRYGANTITAILAVFLWLVAIVANTYGTILYWRLGWLCNVSGKSQLSGTVELEICNSEDPLLISLWVLGTILWILSIVAAVAQGFDFFQTSRAGKSAPGTDVTIERVLFGLFALVVFLCFFGMWLANWITSTMSWSDQTFAVWAHTNLFLFSLAACTLSFMLFMRYGSNLVTATAVLIVWGVAFFANTYGAVLYWRLWWFCDRAGGSGLRGNDLIICNSENSYLVAVWIFATIIWFMGVAAPIAHGFDWQNARSQGQSINPLRSDVGKSLITRRPPPRDAFDIDALKSSKVPDQQDVFSQSGAPASSALNSARRGLRRFVKDINRIS